MKKPPESRTLLVLMLQVKGAHLEHAVFLNPCHHTIRFPFKDGEGEAKHLQALV